MIRRFLERIARLAPGSDLLPDMQDVLVFGGLGAACYGVAELAGVPAACVLGGGALFWLGVRNV